MQAIPMTLRGAEKLREELDFLKSCLLYTSDAADDAPRV